MMPSRNWKDVFRDAMFACAKLRTHKAQMVLLEYIIHKSHSKLQMCWVSQHDMAEVSGCNERNIKKLLVGLQEIGALDQVRFSVLPPKDQKAINALSPRPLSNNSNVYFPCLGWADDILSSDDQPATTRPGTIRISQADRKRGSDKANDRRRRYAPADLAEHVDIATHPDHEDWLFLNALGEKGGLSWPPIIMGKGGLSGTGISIEEKQAAISAPTNGGSPIGFDPPFSQAITSQDSISSPPYQPGSCSPHGYGGGEASACDPSPPGLARPEGKTKSPEQVAAGARAKHRRAS